jgi:hypothetical protein
MEQYKVNPPEMLTVPLPMDGDYATVEEALAGLTALEQSFRVSNDRRAVFIGAYIAITAAMQQAIGTGEFKDDIWVRQYLLHFVRLYMKALNAFEQGDLEHVPAAWRVAFQLSSKGEGLVIQHLLLGVNAHINHDLAIALMGAGIDPDRPMRYNDHTGVNEVLKRAANSLQDHVERLYAPSLHILDQLLGHWDEDFACLMVDKARETAWHHCLALADCATEEDREAVLHRIDEHAGALAELIAQPYTSPLHLFQSVRTAF